VFEFPHPEGSEQEGFGAGEGAGGGHGVFAVAMAVGTTAWATRFLAGLRFAHGPGGRAGDVKVAAVHNFWYYS